MLTTRWVRWFLFRCLARMVPPLRRWLNFPVDAVAALDVADEIIEDSEERLTLDIDDARFLEIHQRFLTLAKDNDVGDCSTYAQRYTPLRSELAIIENCIVSGRTLGVARACSMTLIRHEAGVANWNFAKPGVLQDRSVDRRRCFVLNSNGHYFHFLANDVLPLLYFLERHGERLGPVSIVASAAYAPFVANTLNALARAYPFIEPVFLAPDERLVDVDLVWHYRFAETGWIPTSREDANHLRDVLLQAYPEATAPSSHARNVFVSRGSTRLRRLSNEAGLNAALAARDFSIFAPDANHHRAQIETFRAARTIVSVHGAALTNLLFCEPGTRVVELFPSDRVKSVYFALSCRLGYRAVIGSPGDFRESFSVDIEDVLAAL
jgi:hypothetical protein